MEPGARNEKFRTGTSVSHIYILVNIKNKKSSQREGFLKQVLRCFVFRKNLVHAATADGALALGSFRAWAHLYDFNILHLPLGLAFHAMTFNLFIHKHSIPNNINIWKLKNPPKILRVLPPW